MTKNTITYGLIRILILSGVVFGTVWFVQNLSGRNKAVNNICSELDSNFESKYIFLGSSRTQSAIVPVLFEVRILNLASGNGNLYNSLCLLNALDLDSGSVVFIELGSLTPRINSSTWKLIRHLGEEPLSVADELKYYLNSVQRVKESSKLLNYKLWEEISLGRDLRMLAGLDTKGKLIGSNGWEGDCTACEFVFTDKSQLENQSHPRLAGILKNILDQSVRAKIKVYFFLPLSFESKNEREKLVELYNSIPVGNRVSFSESSRSLENHNFFADELHLNITGRQKYSQLVKSYIKTN
ncbi:MAG: hypothetical protein AAGC47_15505 [Bacteroidota bacterium]